MKNQRTPGQQVTWKS